MTSQVCLPGRATPPGKHKEKDSENTAMERRKRKPAASNQRERDGSKGQSKGQSEGQTEAGEALESLLESVKKNEAGTAGVC